MNILFFGANAANPTLGGIARISYNLVSFFSQNGYSCVALAHASAKKNGESLVNQQYFPDDNLYSEVNSKYLQKIICEHKIDVIINQTAMSRQSVDFLYRIKEDNPNIKIVSCIHNPLLNQIINYPYLKEFRLKQHHLSFCFKVMRNPLCTFFYRAAGIFFRKYTYALDVVRKSDKILMLSPGHMQELIDIVGENDKICYIPNCISLEHNLNSKKENLVLWIGHIDTSVKRIDYMLEAWMEFSVKYPLWKLLVLGDGPALEWAKSFVTKNNIRNVQFLGRVDPNEYYKRAKFSCITSSYESFSMVIIESFKYGVIPIVNNSFSSASYLIKDGYNGILAPKFNLKSYVEAMKKLASDSHRVEVLSKNSLSSAQEYSVTSIGQKWIELLQNL